MMLPPAEPIPPARSEVQAGDHRKNHRSRRSGAPPGGHAETQREGRSEAPSGARASGEKPAPSVEPAPEIEFDPGLVEHSVLAAVDRLDRIEQRHFREERDPLYRIASPEEREEAFRALHARWFLALDLGTLVEALVREQPLLARATCRRVVLRAGSSRDEGADLHSPPAGTASHEPLPSLLIRLLPRTLLDRRLEHVMRRELLHAADMLDPAFGYERTWLGADRNPGRVALVRDRYRILWETTVEGRLERRGLLSPGAESKRRALFAAAFPMLGEDRDLHFRRFFSGPRPSHAELAAFAAIPPSSSE